MNLNLSESQEIVRESVLNYLTDNYNFDTHLKHLNNKSNINDLSRWENIAELGWLSISLSEELGGLGGGALDTWALMKSYGTSLCTEPLLSSAVISAPLLASAKQSNLAKSTLEQMLSGQIRVALAHTEEIHYKPSSRIRSTAKTTENGYVLTGQKKVVPDAGIAAYVIVPCLLTDQNNDLGLFLLPVTQQGVEKNNLPMADGSVAADLSLHDVVLDKSHLLLSGASAKRELELAFARALAGQAAETVGAMQSVLELTRQYLHDRKQFGRPLAGFQALQHRYADMVIAYERAFSMSLLAANCLDEYEKEPKNSLEDLHRSKVVIGQSARLIGAEGIQLHGGMGMTQEYPVGHYYRKLLLNDTFYGSNQAHLNALLEQA